MRPLLLAVLLLATSLPLLGAQAPEQSQTVSGDTVPVPQPSEKALIAELSAMNAGM